MSELEFSDQLNRLWSVIVSIPAPVALLVGPEHRHELVNNYYKMVSGEDGQRRGP